MVWLFCDRDSVINVPDPQRGWRLWRPLWRQGFRGRAIEVAVAISLVAVAVATTGHDSNRSLWRNRWWGWRTAIRRRRHPLAFVVLAAGFCQGLQLWWQSEQLRQPRIRHDGVPGGTPLLLVSSSRCCRHPCFRHLYFFTRLQKVIQNQFYLLILKRNFYKGLQRFTSYPSYYSTSEF